MEVDKGNKNCYNCGELARNCKNRRIGNRIGEGIKLEYRNKNNRQNNLNGDRELIVLN